MTLEWARNGIVDRSGLGEGSAMTIVINFLIFYLLFSKIYKFLAA
jgi:hypothetical protein